ncbi:Protein of unknown function [Pyronema omphalodes CBS 100304]|uniref:Uncharacterized protein n=1 Tax=Pyronema omphalodes (strain CBS 100304) TaxID=1076935 RepID=U4LF67_PYROM|nr:Protein of unknown function [Pyronema omphalodes CBS 100304]
MSSSSLPPELDLKSSSMLDRCYCRTGGHKVIVVVTITLVSRLLRRLSRGQILLLNSRSIQSFNPPLDVSYSAEKYSRLTCAGLSTLRAP